MGSLEGELKESSPSTIAGESRRILFRMKRLKKVLFQNEEAVAVEGEGEVEPIALRVVHDLKRLGDQKPLIIEVRVVRRVSLEARPADLEDCQRRMRQASSSMKKSRTAKLG